LLITDELNPLTGLHVYDVPPLAESAVDNPLQIVASDPAFAVGNELTITTTASVEEQPAEVTVTV
jgi:hypothetical protein